MIKNRFEGGSNPLSLKIAVFMFPILLIASLLYVKEVDHGLYRVIVKEDGVIEYLTCISYFMAFILALLIANAFRNLGSGFFFAVYLIFSVCLLFVAGEEISWGQRLFKIRTPDFFLENNIQYETNLHNLKQIHSYNNRLFILIGLFGSSFWLVLACLERFNTGKLRTTCIPYLTPPWYLASYFLPTVIFFYYIEYLFPQHHFFSIRYKEQEPVELILSLGFLLFVAVNRVQQIVCSIHGGSKG